MARGSFSDQQHRSWPIYNNVLYGKCVLVGRCNVCWVNCLRNSEMSSSTTLSRQKDGSCNEGMQRPCVLLELEAAGTTWAKLLMVWVMWFTFVVKSFTTLTSPATAPCISATVVPIFDNNNDATPLNDFILTVKKTPEIIAISETKLQDENIYNISILGYVFLNTNSPTRAGGVDLYISKELTFIRRQDLEITGDGIESCWVKIMLMRML